MLRGLIHFWRLNVAVMLAAAVATAVLTGALLVGDSVRGSLRDLTLQRLGRVDDALVRDRFFRAALADDLAAHPRFDESFAAAAPAILVRASAVHADSGARASRVQLQGIDKRFADLLDWGGGAPPDLTRGEGQSFPSIVINERLAGELGAEVGDPILISFERATDVPRDTLLGEKDPSSMLGRLRLTLTRIVPDRDGGRFGLAANQVTPLNAFVEMDRLQRALDLDDEVNALLVARRTGAPVDPALLDELVAETLTLEDTGLLTVRRDGVLSVESPEYILRPRVLATLEEVAARLEMPLRHILTYLANRMEIGDRLVPYSTVTAIDAAAGEPFEALRTTSGGEATGLAAGEILLNSWAAEDLEATPGDTLEMTYFAVGPREELIERQESFRVRGVVAMAGLGADRSLTPDFPGIHDADDMASWDPPFPVELSAIRKKDEDYWDEWKAVPKAFLSEADGRRLWATRHGESTAVRVAVGDAAGEARFRQAVLDAIDPVAQGFRFQPVKEQGLAGAVGATNFSEYFSYFSFFIIFSAALLVGLLFRLGVEQRAREVGLLLAVGFPVTRVRRRLLAEGIVLAVIGGALGVAGGWAYAWLMMAGLRTVWLGAVGTPVLFLHVAPQTPLVGLLGAVVIVVLTIWLALGVLRRVPTPLLLAGAVQAGGRRRAGAVAPWLAPLASLSGIGLLAAALITGNVASVGLTVGAGFSLLIGGLSFFSVWCRRHGRGGGRRGHAGLTAMAARNSAWNPGRSILSVILVASACFIIILVGAFRHEYGDELLERSSGTGGYAVMAEATVPLHLDLDKPEDRLDLGLTDEAPFVPGVTIHALRVLPGNDTSCLNLYEPDSPRVLGVPHTVIERGGFTFSALAEGVGDGWAALESPSFEPGVIPAIADGNSAQWIWKLGIGEDVVVENEFGEDLRLRLVGLLQKSLFQSEILVSEAHFLEHFPSRSGYSAFLIDAPPGRGAAVGEVLEGGLERFGLDATSTVRRLADFQAVENTYMSTFEMLGGLGLLLGTVGLGIVLLRNVIERRGELATLRAFGFRRRRLAWLVVAENGFLLIVGITTGSLAALLAVSPRLLAGTLHLPWLFLGATLAAVLAVGMLSCVAAVQGALRVPLLAVLKAER